MYYFSKILRMPFDKAVAHVTDALKVENFGIITEIDIKKNFTRKNGR